MGKGVMKGRNASDIYHDIYDFSLFPVSLGDIVNWGVKSALRAATVGRKKAHIHLIVDLQKSGFSPFQASSYLIDLFVVEAIPAFYTHPYFSGISVYRSREDFETTFGKIAQGDDISLQVYLKHESEFEERKNYDRLGEYFRMYCSSQLDINEYYKRNGTFPKIGYLDDCLVDWQNLQAQFPAGTFWVTAQFRLRKLDGGMPVSEEGLKRDASFLSWYQFIDEAYRRYPSVRFVLLGRLQEKPLEFLRLPNVVTLRTLGMNLSHELTALLHSDLYMGSPSGFAQAAHFSDVPYDIFGCTETGCAHYGIPFGADRLPIAGPPQKLHYGVEEPEGLLKCLGQALTLKQGGSAFDIPFQTNRVGSTDRFFTHDGQGDAELSILFANRLKPLALAIERGEYLPAQQGLKKIGDTFPRFVLQWPEFAWLSGVLDFLLNEPQSAGHPGSGARRHELLTEISRYCHPSRLVRRSGWHFENLLSSDGFQSDGWCEKKATLVFAPSNPGDYLIIRIARVAAGEATRLSVRINQQKPVSFVLLNEHAVLEIPVLQTCVPTEIFLEADRSFKVKSRDEKEYSYQIEGAALVAKRPPMQTFYLADKRDPREKVASGIYHNGSASSLARIRIDNPFSDDTEIMIHLMGRVPSRWLRKGQLFRIQVNEDEPHESFIAGKRFEAIIPCSGRPRHIAILLQFWSPNELETIPRENRAIIGSIHVLPSAGRKADIKTGYRSVLNYWLNNLKSKISKKVPKPV
jgi:hypothetical protein